MAPWIDEQFRFAYVHMDLERDIADFLGTEASILYFHGFSTIPCVTSAFEKRGDVILADPGNNLLFRRAYKCPAFAGSSTMTSEVSKTTS